VRAALRGVYSRLLALKSRQPITGAEIASALEELGVRVDTTTAGILEQHVTPNVPPELHPGGSVGFLFWLIDLEAYCKGRMQDS
jgi:hypothetical protein